MWEGNKLGSWKSDFVCTGIKYLPTSADPEVGLGICKRQSMRSPRCPSHKSPYLSPEALVCTGLFAAAKKPCSDIHKFTGCRTSLSSSLTVACPERGKGSLHNSHCSAQCGLGVYLPHLHLLKFPWPYPKCGIPCSR